MVPKSYIWIREFLSSDCIHSFLVHSGSTFFYEEKRWFTEIMDILWISTVSQIILRIWIPNSPSNLCLCPFVLVYSFFSCKNPWRNVLCLREVSQLLFPIHSVGWNIIIIIKTETNTLKMEGSHRDHNWVLLKPKCQFQECVTDGWHT